MIEIFRLLCLVDPLGNELPPTGLIQGRADKVLMLSTEAVPRTVG